MKMFFDLTDLFRLIKGLISKRSSGYILIPWIGGRNSLGVGKKKRVRYLYAFEMRKAFKFPVRNKIDERVLNQVFVARDYGFFRLKRGGSVRSIMIV